MYSIKTTCTIFFTALFLSLNAQPIVIDESKATVAFVFMDDDVDGTISDFKFTGNIDLNNLTESSFSGSVAMNTLDTDNWLRNRHLRSKKYFNNKQYPRLYFKSTAVRDGGGREFLVEGTLTIKGISKPVTLTFTRRTNELYGGVMINTGDFDINIHDESDRNMTQIRITLPYTIN